MARLMIRMMWRDAQSTLKDGIETVLIPILDPHDQNELLRQSERGTYAIVEWLLSKLYRSTEIDRACGLSVSVDGQSRLVAQLELRQPGKQFEEWLKSHNYKLFGPPEMELSERALSQEKFSDKHSPWWVKQEPVTTVQEEGTSE